MTEVTELLGSTGVVPAGDYSPEKTYDFLNMVYAAPSVYVSRKGDNTGHPVTDTDWWMLSIDGSKNPEAVKAALDAAAAALEAAAAAAPVVVNVEGAAAAIDVQPNHIYKCGELTSLNIRSVADSPQIAEVIFTSGATATELTMPNTLADNVTGWKIPQANKTYKIFFQSNTATISY